MNIFGMGLPEMAVILVLALLIFGPKKLPEIGRSLGKTLRSFQDASKEFENELKQEVNKMERSTKTSMEAELETPPPQALSPTEAEPMAAEVSQSSEAEPPEAAAEAEKEAASSETAG